MGLFDVFSRGGRYFGKAIEPKCEYCEYGQRATNGNEVLCSKKGMVDAGFHCPKFTYSPLKRIPTKQMNKVGFLEGDYDEKEDLEEAAEEQAKKPEGDAPKPDDAAKAAAPAAKAAKSPAPAAKNPAPAAKAAAPAAKAPAPATKAAAPAAKDSAPAPAPIPTPGVKIEGMDELAALAAAVEASGDYNPEEEEKPSAKDSSDAPSQGSDILSDM